MKSLMKSGVAVGVALLAAALVGVTAAAENPSDNLQGSWNDYPAKWIQTPTSGPVPWGDDAQQPSAETQTYQPEDDRPHGYLRPWPIPEGPRQQQQGKPSGGGGGFGGKQGGSFGWGWGGKTGGGGFGGKQGGGGFSWGKTRPPQSQQGAPRPRPRPQPQPGDEQEPRPQEDDRAAAREAELLRYIEQLHEQNRELKKLLERLSGGQGDGERDTNMGMEPQEAPPEAQLY